MPFPFSRFSLLLLSVLLVCCGNNKVATPPAGESKSQTTQTEDQKLVRVPVESLGKGVNRKPAVSVNN